MYLIAHIHGVGLPSLRVAASASTVAKVRILLKRSAFSWAGQYRREAMHKWWHVLLLQQCT